MASGFDEFVMPATARIGAMYALFTDFNIARLGGSHVPASNSSLLKRREWQYLCLACCEMCMLLYILPRDGTYDWYMDLILFLDSYFMVVLEVLMAPMCLYVLTTLRMLVDLLASG